MRWATLIGELLLTVGAKHVSICLDKGVCPVCGKTLSQKEIKPPVAV